MGYITGTMSDANPGATLYALIAAEMTTMGYELVDTVVIGSNTHKVWKNPAANNPAGLDWYVDLYYPTAGAGSVKVVAFEAYDAAADRAYRLPGYAGNLDATYRSFFPTATSLEAAGGAYARPDILTSTASFGYWISITEERIAVIGSVDPTYMLYAGLYDPYPGYAAAAGEMLFPLVSAKIIQGISQIGGSLNVLGLNRLPPWPAGSAPYNDLGMRIVIPNLTTNYPRIPTGSLLMGGEFVASKIELILNGVVAPARLGTLYDVAILPVDSTVARGDTVTIDGNTWVLGSSGSNTAHAIRQNA